MYVFLKLCFISIYRYQAIPCLPDFNIKNADLTPIYLTPFINILVAGALAKL